MFSIAICDDEQAICYQIENTVLDYFASINEKVDVQVFDSGEELCQFMQRDKNFDLLFLDIELKLLNGIEVGKKIREEYDNQILQIVYISGKDSYFKDLFDVRPMHFLSKPLVKTDIIKDIKLAMKLADRLGGMFTYKKGHEIYRYPIKNILYFENNGREVNMVTVDGKEAFYSKLEEVYMQVAKYQFMYIHKSYIVNYSYVTKFKFEEVTMSNSVVLPISQARRRATRELQIQYEKEGLR